MAGFRCFTGIYAPHIFTAAETQSSCSEEWFMLYLFLFISKGLLVVPFLSASGESIIEAGPWEPNWHYFSRNDTLKALKRNGCFLNECLKARKGKAYIWCYCVLWKKITSWSTLLAFFGTGCLPFQYWIQYNFNAVFPSNAVVLSLYKGRYTIAHLSFNQGRANWGHKNSERICQNVFVFCFEESTV